MPCHTDIQTVRQTDSQADRQTVRQTDSQANRQSDRQTKPLLSVASIDKPAATTSSRLRVRSFAHRYTPTGESSTTSHNRRLLLLLLLLFLHLHHSYRLSCTLAHSLRNTYTNHIH